MIIIDPIRKSSNYSSRHSTEPAAIIIHYTAGGSAEGSINWLCDGQSKVSCHFLIARDGDQIQLVDTDLAAWHCGISEIEIDNEMKANANLYTIGIELANHGLLQKINGSFYYELGRGMGQYKREEPVFAKLVYDDGRTVEGYWEPYPDEQIDSLQDLLLKLKKSGYDKAVNNPIGHEEIAMPLGRKMDPGPLFPWHRFVRKIDRRTMFA